MNPSDPRHLLGGYVTSSLNKTEENRLMQAALENQDLFDELLDLEQLRGALEDPRLRAQIKNELRARVNSHPLGLIERLRRLLFRPYVVPAVSLGAVALLLLLVRQGFVERDSLIAQVTLSPPGSAMLRAASLTPATEGEEQRLTDARKQPPPAAASGSLMLDRSGSRPSYRVGDRMRIGFRLKGPAAAVLIEERSGGSSVRLFPNRFQESPQVSAGQPITVPPPGQGDLEVEAPPGARTLRLLIFPPDTDPLNSGERWETLRQKAATMTAAYRVEP
jgi:hypothetical protein